jgi:hypothetical protein
MICPDCGNKISSKHYDADYLWYECPKCEGCFTPDEILKTELNGKKKGPIAKAKKRMTEIQEDEEALAEYEAEALKPRKAAESAPQKRKDTVPTGQVLNIIADEIEAIGEEIGVRIDRLNAREFFAINLWRSLVPLGVEAREAEFQIPLCKEHKAL